MSTVDANKRENSMSQDVDTGPSLLQTETMGIFLCQAPERPDGQRYLTFSGTTMPSLPDVIFGLCLNPETTQQEAEALAELINKRCPTLWGAFYDRPLSEDYWEPNEHGLADLGDDVDPAAECVTHHRSGMKS